MVPPTLPVLLGVSSPPGCYRYEADALARPIRAEGWLVRSAAARDHAPQAQVRVGLGDGVDAGHLIPARFGGSSGEENLVPMSARHNRSYVLAVEHAVERRLTSGPLYLLVEVSYRGRGRFPESIRHRLFRLASTGRRVEPVPGGDVTTFGLANTPSSRFGDLRDPHDGRSIGGRRWFDPADTTGRGPHGPH